MQYNIYIYMYMNGLSKEVWLTKFRVTEFGNPAFLHVESWTCQEVELSSTRAREQKRREQIVQESTRCHARDKYVMNDLFCT